MIQMTTKSGTNELHGSAYEFFRNNVLNARTFFAATNPVLRYNLFGASLGGPIKKNKTFFFYNYEGLREITYVATILGVPTVAETQGNFSADKTVVKDPKTGVAFPGNIIPATMLDPVGAKLASFYPAPNVAGQPSGHTNFLNESAIRNDRQQSHCAHRPHVSREGPDLWPFRRLHHADVYECGFCRGSRGSCRGASTHQLLQRDGELVSMIFSPTVLNEFRTGSDLRSSHTYSSVARDRPTRPSGSRGVDPAAAPNVIVPGLLKHKMGTTTQQRFQVPTLALPIIDHLSVIRGRHQFAFGVPSIGTQAISTTGKGSPADR